MARPTAISDETLLEAARDVFLEHGIRATTAEVARRAGVSEGTLFKRFRTKQGLFEAAMTRSFEEDAKRFVGSLLERVGKGTLRGELEDVALRGIDFFRKIVPLHMMCWSNPGKDGLPVSPSLEGREHPALGGRRLFEAYFEAERRLGRLRNVDVGVLARVFMGAVYNFAAMEVMLAAEDPLPMPAETFARGLVDILLRGIEANSPEARPARRTRA
ncbi:MAG: TetR/AcrR family transcriptional regulator [Sandaracinaceae bacterium]